MNGPGERTAEAAAEALAPSRLLTLRDQRLGRLSIGDFSTPTALLSARRPTVRVQPAPDRERPGRPRAARDRPRRRSDRVCIFRCAVGDTRADSQPCGAQSRKPGYCGRRRTRRSASGARRAFQACHASRRSRASALLYPRGCANRATAPKRATRSAAVAARATAARQLSGKASIENDRSLPSPQASCLAPP